MHTGIFNPELWAELSWNFLFILMIPAAVTMVLLILTVIAEVVSLATDEQQGRNKKVYTREPSRSRELEV